MRTTKKLFLFVILLSLTAGLVWLWPVGDRNSAFAQGEGSYYTYLPIFQNHHQLLTSTSYYMITIDSEFTYDLGCDLGTRDKNEPGVQNSVAVLDFSYPICNTNGTYGAELFGFGPVPLSQIETAARAFLLGYYECSGYDNDSQLVVGIGTNNKPTSCDTAQEMTDHGAAWAEMVNSVNQWATDNSIIHQVQAYGASDMELGWNTPSMSRNWLAGYESSAAYPMIHFGDAAGCPYEDRPYLDCGTSSFPEWTSEDVWFVSWGSGVSLPLPLIYLTSGIHAQQWAFLSQYGVSAHGTRMDFTGVFTQSQACEQWGCSGTDNTPEEAYWQLYNELYKYPETAQELNWSTDIRWILREEAYPDIYSAAEGSTTPGVRSGAAPKAITFLQAELENPDLSAEAQANLETKLALLEHLAQLMETSRQAPAPKTGRSAITVTVQSDPQFTEGIPEGGSIAGLPYGATLTRLWQQQSADGYLQVGAGAAPGNPAQGALYIQKTTLNKAASTSQMILAEEGAGMLRIIAENENALVVQSESGWVYFFDWQTLTLTADPH